MATLSNIKRKDMLKKKLRFSVLFFVSFMFVTPYAALYMDLFFSHNLGNKDIKVTYLGSFESLFTNRMQLIFFGFLQLGVLLFQLNSLTKGYGKVGQTDTIKVTDNIEIPVAVGRGQHGTSRFMTEEEKDKIFFSIIYDIKKGVVNSLDVKKRNVGIVVGMERIGKREIVKCVSTDKNTIMIGATRSGKGRRSLIESIYFRSFSGRSMVVVDVKGELYLYLNEFLKSQGYETVAFDLREPKKSRYHNYMKEINKAVDDGDIPTAIDKAWDLVSVMVGIPKGEPLWTNGECSVIASVILLISMEAPQEYRNCTNVYYFISNMCKADNQGKMPITEYYETLDDSHPAKGLFDVAEVSPEKMRGSFFGMALTTLRLFTNWNVADITSESDFDINELGQKKMALFIIVHDEKTTYYPLITLLINQIYVSLVEFASKCGGRLPVEVDYVWDECGNSPPAPSLGTMVSAGLSRGIRFCLVLQDYEQLQKKYKDDHGNIKANCMVTIYFKSIDIKTREELSKRTGTYTIEVNSVSSSTNGKSLSGSNFSSSVNMQSRALLTQDEIGRIEKPYSLVFDEGNYPAIFNSPDLSEYHLNKALGLGDEEHNRNVIFERNNARPEHEIRPMQLWGVWNDFKARNDEAELYDDFKEKASSTKKERVSFLDND